MSEGVEIVAGELPQTARWSGGWRRLLVALMLGAGCLWLYIDGLGRVPFHPDESAWIFMSHDFDLFIQGDFERLVWTRNEPVDDDVFLRLINAPLPKYLIGAGRWITGHGNDLTTNWDWTASWDANGRAGALPSPWLLQAAREAATGAAVLSLMLLFLLGSETAGLPAAAAGTLLLATHPLSLLHTRRAMAESTAQLFSMVAVLTVALLAVSERPPIGKRRRRLAGILAGAAIGLAIAAKQNAVPLLATGLAAAVRVGVSAQASRRDRLRIGMEAAGTVIAATLVAYFAANPVLYRQPLRGAKTMLSLRSALARNQARATALLAPDTVTPTIGSRLAAAWREVYWNDVAFSESSKYDDRIAADVASFESGRLIRVWRSLWMRLSFVLLSGLGAALAIRDVIRDRFGWRTTGYQIGLVWVAAEIAFVCSAIPLDWQRYFLPLLPPIALFAGLGTVRVGEALGARGPRRRPRPAVGRESTGSGKEP